ncbi:MAG: hypothetical protein AAFY60_04690, partial [Myxococcota bacterium]
PKPPSEVTDREISPALEQLVLRCLAKQQIDRPANGRELLHTLERMEISGSWRDRDAAEWWDEYGEVLALGVDGESVDSALRTIDIDMERRRAARATRSQQEALL